MELSVSERTGGRGTSEPAGAARASRRARTGAAEDSAEGLAVTSQNGTQAIDRAAQLLTQVLGGGQSVGFTGLASASGLAKSTTARLLMALQRHQLVRRDDGGRFWPGELFVRYAWRGTASADLVAIAQPFLEQLGELTGETV